MAFDWFTNRSLITKIIFLLIILYAVSSAGILIFALFMFSSLERVFLNPLYTLAYAIVSFLFAAAISAYHFSTMIRRRKRKTDKIPAETPAAS